MIDSLARGFIQGVMVMILVGIVMVIKAVFNKEK